MLSLDKISEFYEVLKRPTETWRYDFETANVLKHLRMVKMFRTEMDTNYQSMKPESGHAIEWVKRALAFGIPATSIPTLFVLFQFLMEVVFLTSHNQEEEQILMHYKPPL